MGQQVHERGTLKRKKKKEEDYEAHIRKAILK